MMVALHSEQQQPIEVRFVADGLIPSAVQSHELAEMLVAIEDLIVASVQRIRPDLEKDAIIIGLAAVESHSIGLQFVFSPESVVIPIFRTVATAIATQSYSNLPLAARKAVKKIAGFTRKHHCVAELRAREGPEGKLLAIIGPEVDIPPAAELVGQTTLYGHVVDAGGKDPNAHIQLVDGTRVTCWGTVEQIKQLANHLYSMVAIDGTARWDTETLEILSFKIVDVLDYDDIPFDQALHALQTVAAGYFTDVDPIVYVRNLRGDDAES
jgi:hypothetical protein